MRPAELAHAGRSVAHDDGRAENAPAAVAVLNSEIVMRAPPDISAVLTHDGTQKTSPVFLRGCWREQVARFVLAKLLHVRTS